jgi:hypothetical protein
MDVHLRAVQPAGFAVPAAAHLHTGVAGARSEAAEFEAKFEIVKFTLVQQPHIAVVGLPARVASDDAVIGLPKSPVNIGRFGLNAPTIQRTAIKVRSIPAPRPASTAEEERAGAFSLRPHHNVKPAAGGETQRAGAPFCGPPRP